MLKSAFASAAIHYADAGYSVIPVAPGEKYPGLYTPAGWSPMTAWNEYGVRLPTEDELDQWSAWPQAGIGLVLGPISDVIALDFDTRPEYHEIIQSLVPPSPVRKKGEKGYTAFYRYAGEKTIRSFKLEGREERPIVEVLSEGAQTVLPPTVHPKGVEYHWLTVDTLLSYDRRDLPVLGMKHIAKIEKFIEELRGGKKTPSTLGVDVQLQEIKDALAVVPSDDYSDWFRVGMALSTVMPGEDGLALWNAWSKTSPKYRSEEMRGRWRSWTGKVRELQIDTLFFLAHKHGYRRPERPAQIEVIPDEAKPEAQSQSTLALSKEILTSAPGLVGQIAAWINRTALYEHPALALGAALAAVGALKGHRVRTETNLRSNLFVIGVAPTGSGKNHAMEKIEELLCAANLGNLFGGKPASDAGLLKSLVSVTQENEHSKGLPPGRRLVQWDELGIAFAQMSSRQASPHKAAILSVMMELFSKAGSVYHGTEYANRDGKSARHDINQPCLCVYGATTPLRFYESLTNSHTVDGFLSRWLIFETHNHYPERRKNPKIEPPPVELVEACVTLEGMATNAYPQGNVDTEIRPRVMFYDAGAARLMDEAICEFDEKRRLGKNDAVEALWTRAAEHAAKIALVVSDGDHITEEAVRWSLEVVKHCVRAMVEVVKTHISENERHRNLNKVMAIIQKAGPDGIKRWELTRKTQFLGDRRALEEILLTLKESYLVAEVGTDSVTKSGVIYKIVT